MRCKCRSQTASQIQLIITIQHGTVSLYYKLTGLTLSMCMVSIAPSLFTCPVSSTTFRSRSFNMGNESRFVIRISRSPGQAIRIPVTRNSLSQWAGTIVPRTVSVDGRLLMVWRFMQYPLYRENPKAWGVPRSELLEIAAFTRGRSLSSRNL